MYVYNIPVDKAVLFNGLYEPSEPPEPLKPSEPPEPSELLYKGLTEYESGPVKNH
ncbi:hypothetical protein DPMN_134909 [Dreissena polymorpha]|uniref:Uncharacterized protein n=1 Tax=Dreissena polymorpha TaxID=45954 RepID=A0A9D4JB46_DREPO|nr:hypothetical protein DPMN_134909 [Dreissena polymorpha]